MSKRLHQAVGPLQPRFGFGPQTVAQADHNLRLLPLDGVIEGRAIRVEVRSDGLFRIAPAFDFTAREME